MELKKAQNNLGDRAEWELKQMKKALTTMGGFFNNEEDNERLRDVETVLRLEKRCGSKRQGGWGFKD